MGGQGVPAPPVPEGSDPDRGVLELVQQLRDEVTRLVRLELKLPRAEVAENAAEAAGGFAKVAVAGVVAFAGLMCLQAAIAVGLGAALIAAGVGPFGAVAVGLLVVTAADLLAAWILFAKGRAQARPESLEPTRTIAGVREAFSSEGGGADGR